ncbi:MMPL family transporter [Nocardiopsis sp. CC223A]|uniref:MMPL family transporter n=1 Tax=Nocardiopsis sp. CC223A TaxID=3044051 RepID=UPI00278BD166|nr:MMPL family transporter [Nocardiopsis sp. CC223A]
MTLRTRLTALLLAVTTLTLTIVVSVGGFTVHRFLTEKVDNQLELVAEFARSRQDEILEHRTEAFLGEVTAPREFLVEVDSPSFSYRDPVFSAPLLDTVAGRARQGTPTTVEHEGEDYRVLYLELPRHDAHLVMAIPLEQVQETVGRLVATGTVTSVVLLALFGSAASSILRWGMRPLDDVVVTAEAIADGDLERRVPESPERARTETGRLTVSINRMLAGLQAALHSRADSEERMRRFAADASHELRTPLTVVRGYLQLIADGVVDLRERTDVIPRAQAEADRMARLVENLLYLSRLDERPATPPAASPTVVSLADLVRECAAGAAAAAPERRIDVEVRDECLVTGDREELWQAVSNLLANVLTHTPQESVATVRLARVGGRPVLSVSDEGPGIGAESAAFVFERFYRDPAARDREGSGLGLSIVRAVMAAHGGTAELESSVSGGTTVTLAFPARDGEGAPSLTTERGFSSDSHLFRDTSPSGADGLAGRRPSARADAPTGSRKRKSMATLLYRIGSFAYRRRWWVLGGWFVAVAAMATLAVSLQPRLDDTFEISGTEAQEAADLLGDRFAERSGGSVTVLVRAPEGEEILADEEYREAVGELADGLAGVEGVEEVVDPFALVGDAREVYGRELAAAEEEARAEARATVEEQVPEGTPGRDGMLAQAEEEAAAQVAEQAPAFDEASVAEEIPLFSDGGRAVLVQVQLTEPDGRVAQETVDGILGSGGPVEEAGLEVEFSGTSLSPPEIGLSIVEVIGVLVAAAVLVLNFGALILAGVPVLVALAGVALGMAAVLVSAAFWDVTSTAPLLAVMLGIAVGIDYSLFVLSRHRQQLSDGMDPHESAARAIGTAGSAVVFAGITVVIALLGLNVVGIPFLGVMGVTASMTVTAAVLGAITLLPALLGVLGPRVTALRVPVLGRRSERALTARTTLGTRWSRFLVRHPVLPVLAVVLVLGAASIPALDMRLGLPNASIAAQDGDERRAYDAIAEEFGAGSAFPLVVVADLRDADDRPGAADEIAERMADLDGVDEVAAPVLNETGDTAVISVVPSAGPSERSTEDLLHEIRGERGSLERETGASVTVTGSTAAGIDISERLNEALVPFLSLVVGLALVLMILVFRSILVPLKAALGFVLSAGAALGTTVLVFQWGYGADLLGVESTPTLLAFLPVLLLGTLFGLAIDYEVFLVSRMREEYVHGASAEEAIVTGFRQGARVVVVAAVIMIAVFTSFVFGPDEMIRPIAFALAVGVLVDAFLVRMTLVPALMALFGRAAWWLPGWLGRWLPSVDIEGEALARPAPVAEPAEREAHAAR